MKEVEVVFPAKFTPTQGQIVAACEKALRVRPGSINSHEVRKKSLDARGGDIKYRYRVNVTLKGEQPIQPYKLQEFKNVADAEPVIVVGCGPAGLFAALKLIQLGLKPIILERGKDVHQRKFDMAKLSVEQIVNPNSNYCFGEGGAGTFSDGKLYTRSTKKGDIREILHLFVHFGADPSILIESHAHIGSDRLPRVIENMRNCVIAHGGQVHFNSHVVDFIHTPDGWQAVVEEVNTPESTSVHKSTPVCGGNDAEITSVHKSTSVYGRNGKLSRRKTYTAKNVILATGHSARDIYELFQAKGWAIEAKGFALGVRVEHPQSLINNIQYHGKYQPYLPTAEYSLVTQVDGRGVFSFCMCPGGILVPAATAEGEMVLNGMSNSARNSKWANAGVVVQVNPEDVPEFAEHGPLQVLRFQQSVEQKLYANSNSIKAPAQRMEDFCRGNISKDLPETSYKPGAYPAPLHELLPPFVATRLQKAFPEFNKKMRGYFTNKALLLAVESRTSSPVRIPRDKETLQHLELPGIYPCGEGAGYAGGIVSSALDGVNCAVKIAGSTNTGK